MQEIVIIREKVNSFRKYKKKIKNKCRIESNLQKSVPGRERRQKKNLLKYKKKGKIQSWKEFCNPQTLGMQHIKWRQTRG
jgi:hypothetical protein